MKLKDTRESKNVSREPWYSNKRDPSTDKSNFVETDKARAKRFDRLEDAPLRIRTGRKRK